MVVLLLLPLDVGCKSPLQFPSDQLAQPQRKATDIDTSIDKKVVPSAQGSRFTQGLGEVIECRLALPPFTKRLLPSLEPETYRSWAKALAIAPSATSDINIFIFL